MLDVYILRSRLRGFVFLPNSGTMEVTIPAGSVVHILCSASSSSDLTTVGYGGSTCNVRLEDLKKLGTATSRKTLSSTQK